MYLILLHTYQEKEMLEIANEIAGATSTLPPAFAFTFASFKKYEPNMPGMILSEDPVFYEEVKCHAHTSTFTQPPTNAKDFMKHTLKMKNLTIDNPTRLGNKKTETKLPVFKDVVWNVVGDEENRVGIKCVYSPDKEFLFFLQEDSLYFLKYFFKPPKPKSPVEENSLSATTVEDSLPDFTKEKENHYTCERFTQTVGISESNQETIDWIATIPWVSGSKKKLTNRRLIYVSR
eukprot:GHVP01037401.1.p1 GENE.GHVP01037401.1~~GHVP01037401.1.p1  ORF type:complete len:233 (+),score=39.07 GHVP01037401.1:466-1164(+)